jgi:3-deoxy-D-manno-octulosonate 8-phosphate phosphatase (KDO 8-P phosphatase)
MKTVNPNLSNSFRNIKAIVLDWDGVFHSGYKSLNGESQFSEADSMGMNMLRLGYYLSNTRIPYTAIVTGENNPTGQFLAEREHFDAIFYKIKDKKIIAEFLLKEKGIKPNEILFVFDDVLDLSLSKIAGVRFLVHRNASIPLQKLITNENLCDFVTINDGGNHAVREICEFTLTQLEVFNNTIQTRIEYGEKYQNYLAIRQAISTQKHTLKDGQLTLV